MLAALPACAVLVVLCYFYVDRPVARLFHGVGGRGFTFMAGLPDFFPPASVALGVLALLLWRRAAQNGLLRVAVLSAAAFVLATGCKDMLKFVFSRTWPETWINHNPSYIHDGVYGFFPFHGGAGWGSFPSGHMSVTGAVLSIFWAQWPRAWPLWLALLLAVAAGLVGMDFHFVGDVIGGTYVGVGAGLFTLRLGARLGLGPASSKFSAQGIMAE